MIKGLFVTVGLIALGLGIVGIFLPLLPTTPFLLLSAACLARGSARLHAWLMSSRLGPYIRDYSEKRGIPLPIKRVSIATLWSTIGITCLYATSSTILRGLLLLVALGVSLHILSLPTRLGADDPLDTDTDSCEVHQ